jgi:hypothetical protein
MRGQFEEFLRQDITADVDYKATRRMISELMAQ